MWNEGFVDRLVRTWPSRISQGIPNAASRQCLKNSKVGLSVRSPSPCGPPQGFVFTSNTLRIPVYCSLQGKFSLACLHPGSGDELNRAIKFVSEYRLRLSFD